MSFVRKLWMFLRARRTYWLLPIVLLLLLFLGLVILTRGSAVAPFVRTIF